MIERLMNRLMSTRSDLRHDGVFSGWRVQGVGVGAK